MSQYENDNPYQFSNEALLRFLDAAPSVGRGKQRHTPERPGIESQDRHSAGLCPSSKIYLRVLLGTAGQEEAEKALSHAATCENCGDLLTASLTSLDGTPSAEEAAAIAQLAAIKTPWQATLAQELAATKAQKQPLPQRLGLLFAGRDPGSGRGVGGGWLVMAGMAAALVAGVALFVWQRHASGPEHLLAMAYAQSRTLELRIPEAGYSAIVPGAHTRGAAAGSEPAPLLEARAGLARKLEGSPQDAHWLELQARADVLGERYDSATDVLDRLIAAGPVTAELLTDAAAAYYQRGLVSGSELDRSTALDYLRRADELAPTDPVVLFNEAIVMEDRGQMMNAVEVWNRYITVERDERWAAEGKRKLAELEQTLNRLKSHQGRIREMLSSPQAMDALASDAKKLASLDEELSSYELDSLLKMAFPVPADGTGASGGRSASGTLGQARGSPCTELCMAARRLLKATATSLEKQHQDFWLSDLLSPDIDSLPTMTAANYGQALRVLGQALREDQTGVPFAGAKLALQSQAAFEQLGRTNAALGPAARAGGERAAVEYVFALQRQVDFRNCRASGQVLRTRLAMHRDDLRYPWIDAQAQVTEKVCDDTSETRRAGRALAWSALHTAEADNYRLLTARIHLMLSGDALDSGDVETGERLVLTTLRQLYAADTPPIRIANTIGALAEIDQDSSRVHLTELRFREAVGWAELAGSHAVSAEGRMDLARAEIRIGTMKDAADQIRLARQEYDELKPEKERSSLFLDSDVLLAESMLERGELIEAAHYLDQVAAHLANYSDSWALRKYSAARGQLELAQGHFDKAAGSLESAIRSNEGQNLPSSDSSNRAEFASLDHDLYAELAATWLAQGRSPSSVLALWERFRLRSRGVPVTQCGGGKLDCDQAMLLAAQRRLGDCILVGQIVLLDRVLIYRVDRNVVSWSEKPVRRQDILETAQRLERAVSSPYTSPETAAKLGANLSDALLPQLPASLNSDASLLLEADPLLQNLSWAVLPVQSGALGLQYPLAEMRSILTGARNEDEHFADFQDGRSALVIGASVAGEGEPPLPEALKEAGSVNRILHSSDLLLGKEATAMRVGTALGSATIFHFAGHALQTGSGTELLLAATSPGEKRPWVDGEFLRRHPPRACRLAVLSACATGVREAAWNHPLQDIVETLGSLGVPEVVATRWQIDSEAAVPFMDVFYTSLEQGTSVAMALTSARSVLSRQTLYRNPYYWGAYYVSGREVMHSGGERHARIQANKEEKRAQN